MGREFEFKSGYRLERRIGMVWRITWVIQQFAGRSKYWRKWVFVSPSRIGVQVTENLSETFHETFSKRRSFCYSILRYFTGSIENNPNAIDGKLESKVRLGRTNLSLVVQPLNPINTKLCPASEN